MNDPIYKILGTAIWQAARDTHADLPWAPIDVQDGFVHLSALHQVRETANRHFAGQEGLTLLQIDPEKLGEGVLRWEVSRGGDRFPHAHGPVPFECVVREDALPWTTQGFVFPDDLSVP